MTDEEFYADRCHRSDLLTSGCACCMGFAHVPTPGDPNQEEHPYMAPLGTRNDRAGARCPNCHEDLVLGETIRTDTDGLRTHWECTA